MRKIKKKNIGKKAVKKDKIKRTTLYASVELRDKINRKALAKGMTVGKYLEFLMGGKGNEKNKDRKKDVKKGNK